MNKDCSLSLVVAVADNGVIGGNGKIPWRCSTDMRRFREITMGKTVIMGRKTWDSLPVAARPLEGRHNIVISRNPNFQPEGAQAVLLPDEALYQARKKADAGEDCEIMVIGGRFIYDMFWAQADRIYLTQVHLSPEGDRFFMTLDELLEQGWQEISREDVSAGPRDEADMSFLVLER